jgi:hypothetical protein
MNKTAFAFGYSVPLFMPGFIPYPEWFIPESLQLI